MMHNASAQSGNQLWAGLQERQSVLPKGNAKAQVAVRVPFRKIPANLTEILSGEWRLDDGWTMFDDSTLAVSGKSVFGDDLEIGYNATVPGTVLTTLVDQGVYPDPYYGLNNIAIPDELCRRNWWYRIQFNTPDKVFNPSTSTEVSLKRYIVFNGINYKSDIYLNGSKIGTTEGAFIRGIFDVTDILKPTENVLAVHVYPPDNPGIPHEQSISEGQGLNGGCLSLDGPTFIASMGWDWIPGIRDRNIGIWQDVRLLSGGQVRIGDPMIVADLPLPDTTSANLYFEIPVVNEGSSSASGKLKMSVISPSGERFVISSDYFLQAGEDSIIRKMLAVNNPQLWWPNGYGLQQLYRLEVEARTDVFLSDEKAVRFGIRELSYELMAADPAFGNIRIEYSPSNRYAAITALSNGDRPSFESPFDNIDRVLVSKDKNIYITTISANERSGIELISQNDPAGWNLIIKVNGCRMFCRGGNWGMDDAMKRCSREHLEPYFALHKDLNFNIIRNWTGESTEEVFYELCDEYGMLVWNDFWITGDDTVEPQDLDLFSRNARDVIRRFRTHPCIAVWCPRNEAFAPVLLGPVLSRIVAEEDPSRMYHGQSRCLNMGTSGPWSYFEDISYYFTQRADGFDTELGSYAVPTVRTIKKFIPEADLWPINDVWAYHDLHHTTQNFSGFMASVNQDEPPEGMEEFVSRTQSLCYDAWRAMLEAWNSKMWNNTTGLILWMSHPAWPSMIWQTYTYDYDTPGSYFGAKKACEPVHIQMTFPDYRVQIVNITSSSMSGLTASAVCYDMDGDEVFSQVAPDLKTERELSFKAIGNAVTECFALALKQNEQVDDTEGTPYLIRLKLNDSKGRLLSTNDYWIGDNRPLGSRGTEHLIIKFRKKDGSCMVEVRNMSGSIVTGVKLRAFSVDGTEILPAFFSDGYFNLLPYEKRTLRLSLPDECVEVFNITVDSCT